MASSDLSSALNLQNRATFKLGLNKLLEIAEEGEEENDNDDGQYAHGGDLYQHQRYWDQMVGEQGSSDDSD